MLTDLEDRHDAWMIQLRRGFGLGVEPLHVLFASELTGQDHLQRDDPIQIDLPRFEDDAHAAAGNLFQQLVVTEVANLVTNRRLSRL